jgi:hypothetical protein
MIKTIFYKLPLSLICLSVFISCYSYQDLDNFTEFEKTGTVSFQNTDLTLIYYKRILDKKERNKPRSGKSYLILKKMSDGSENIIFQDHLGFFFHLVFVDKEKQRLVYTVRNTRGNNYEDTYIVFFDLNTMKEIKKISVKNSIKKNKREDFIYDPNVTSIGTSYIDEINKKFIFRIWYSKGEVFHWLKKNDNFIYNEGKDYIVFDLATELTDEILLEEDKKISDYYQISKKSSAYTSEGETKKLFYIFPDSKNLGKYYKSEYYGTYINDGINNIRISNLYNDRIGYENFWLEDGKYVISGSYLLDTSGKMNELKITDGTVMAIY